MHEVFLEFSFFGKPVLVTAWKLIGYGGVAIFAGRWFVQAIASHRAGRSYIPRIFWYISLCGSLMLLSYFTFGKNDSVGILANLFPAFIAGYNLFLDIRHGKRMTEADETISEKTKS
jgi:lipid-A-disaccharide synthase-like uncharacterized protein